MAAIRFTEKLRSFRALEGRDKWMLLHAFVWLGLARITWLQEHAHALHREPVQLHHELGKRRRAGQATA